MSAKSFNVCWPVKLPRRKGITLPLPQYWYSVPNILHVHVPGWPTLNLVILQIIYEFEGCKLEHGVLVNATDSCRVLGLPTF